MKAIKQTMTHTHNINLNLLFPHQIHKEFLINENSTIVDAMMYGGIQSRTSNKPKDNSKIGDKYIVPENSHEWHGNTNQIAIQLENKLHYIQPKEGMIFWLIDEEKLIVFSENNWKTLAVTLV